MSYSSSQSRKRSLGSTRQNDSTKKPKSSPYDSDFEQKLIDDGIYPEGHEYSDGRPQPTPANFDDIQRTPTIPRVSLSPLRFSDAEFREFRRQSARAANESTAMTNIIPIITGQGDTQHRSAASVIFNHLQPIGEDLTTPMPDVYYGAPPAAIDRRVRADLGQHIVPSKNKSQPAVPNCFLEAKGAQRRADVARRQACYNGATGARAMHSLPNYGADHPAYDVKAYSFSNTYHYGQLKIYATHPT